MIRLEGITRDYDGIRALNGVDLTLERGEWMGLVGPNGSGKTTLIRILLGLTRQTSGTLRIEGEIPDRAAWLRFKSRAGYMPERIRLYENLTGEEILRYFASIRGVDPLTIPPLLDRVGLADAAGRKVGGWSRGMRQRLNLAQALLADPDVLILDEPTEGLDPHAVRSFFRLLRGDGERARQRSVLLSSHRLAEIESQVDRVCILGEGRVRALGTPRALMAEFKLPVRIHVLFEGPVPPEAETALEALGFTAGGEEAGHRTSEVPYREKASVLSKLFALGPDPADVWIEEPDLEEVYFETH
jgi:Cu-processing system ATP-binding protein